MTNTQLVLFDQTKDTALILIQENKKGLLGQLDLASVNTNLMNAAGLLFVAYNALAKTQIQSKLSGLQKDLLQTCKKSILTIQGFQDCSEGIIDTLERTYKFLLMDEPNAALSNLRNCSKKAEKMAFSCTQLATAYQEMSDKSQSALEASIDEENITYIKIDEIKKELQEFKAQQTERKILAEGIEEDLIDINDMSAKVSAEEAAAAKSFEKMQIASLITGAISGLTGAFTGAMKDKSSASSKDDPQVQAFKEQQKQAQNSLGEKEKEKEKKKSELNELRSKITADKIDLENFEKELAKLKANNENTNEIEKQITGKNKQLLINQQKITTLEDDLKDYQKAIDGITAGLNELSNQMQKATDFAEARLNKIQDKAQQLLTKKFELQKQKRESLASMAKFAEMIKNREINQADASTAVKTLQLAVMALTHIVTSLLEAASFWESLKAYCDKLGNLELDEEVESSQLFSSKEIRLNYYKSNDFKLVLLKYACSWYALSETCGEFLRAAQITEKEINNNFVQVFAPELAWKIAKEKAQLFLNDIEGQMELCTNNQKQLETERKELNKK